jgi:hypothetical protein
MKKQILVTLTMVSFFVMVAAVSARAQTGGLIKADIPFTFTVGDKTLPSGEYIIERINRQTIQETLLIRTTDGRTSVLVRTMPFETNAGQHSAKLVFNCYGEKRYLSQLWTPADDFGLELHKSRMERELQKELRMKASESELTKNTPERHVLYPSARKQ